MPQNFQVNVGTARGRALVTVHGELDLLSSGALEETLHEFESGDVVIDLRELEFIDSTGLGVLVKAHQRLRDEGRELALLLTADGQVSRLLALTGLTDELTIADEFTIADGEFTGLVAEDRTDGT